MGHGLALEHLDDDASRTTRINDGSGSDTNIVRYRYLGAGHVVGVLYNQPDIEGNAYNGSDVYDALDRFNRLIISRWVKNPSTDRYKVTLSYDRNSNITDVDDSVQSGLDWQYTYDDLDRLTRARAGRSEVLPPRSRFVSNLGGASRTVGVGFGPPCQTLFEISVGWLTGGVG